MITTAHAHKSGVIFHIFPRAFKQKKIKALRPKMTKIASRPRGGGGGGPALINIQNLRACYRTVIAAPGFQVAKPLEQHKALLPL